MTWIQWRENTLPMPIEHFCVSIWIKKPLDRHTQNHTGRCLYRHQAIFPFDVKIINETIILFVNSISTSFDYSHWFRCLLSLQLKNQHKISFYLNLFIGKSGWSSYKFYQNVPIACIGRRAIIGFFRINQYFIIFHPNFIQLRLRWIMSAVPHPPYVDERLLDLHRKELIRVYAIWRWEKNRKKSTIIYWF